MRKNCKRGLRKVFYRCRQNDLNSRGTVNMFLCSQLNCAHSLRLLDTMSFENPVEFLLKHATLDQSSPLTCAFMRLLINQ